MTLEILTKKGTFIRVENVAEHGFIGGDQNIFTYILRTGEQQYFAEGFFESILAIPDDQDKKEKEKWSFVTRNREEDGDPSKCVEIEKIEPVN